MMHIIMAGDRRVLSGIEVVLYSTMLHNTNVHWHLFSMDIDVRNDEAGVGYKYTGLTKEDEKWLRHIVKYLDFNSELTLHDVHNIYENTVGDSVNKYTNFTPYASLRLLADLVLPKDVQQTWYLDADLLIQDDISDIYYKLLRNRDYNYAAYSVPDANSNAGEMISGVLIMNLEKARREGWLQRARFNYNRNLYRYPDQKALEDAAEFYVLEETYGYLQDHRQATYKPKILHFTNVNAKIYDSNVGIEKFYKYWPEHKYIKEGIDIARELYDIDKLIPTTK